MKKQIAIFTALSGLGLLLSNFTFAQQDRPVSPVDKGSVTVNLGAGVGAEYNSEYYKSSLSSKVAVEVGMWKAGPGTITLGGQIGGSAYQSNRSDNYKSNTLIAGGRSAWHAGWKVPGLDTYAGVSAGIGYQHYEYFKNQTIKQTDIIPVFGGFIGASYFFSPVFGVNVEAGNDITTIQGGIIFKFK